MFMKQPWQIWLVFVLSLAIVLPGMGWLTVKSLELDEARNEALRDAEASRQQAEASQQLAEQAQRVAEEQDLLSNALWRMDTALTPILAQEAARPYFVYEPFVASLGRTKGDPQPTPSPILTQPSPYVLLHFQITPEQQWSSPQQPIGAASDLAITNSKTTLTNIQCSADRLDQLKKFATPKELLAQTPKEFLPELASVGDNLNGAWAANLSGSLPLFFAPNQPNNDSTQQDQFAQAEELPNPGSDSNLPQAEPQQTFDEPAVQANSRMSQSVAPVIENSAGNELFQSQFANAAPLPEQDSMQRKQQLRGGNDWERRNRVYQSYAQYNVKTQRANPDFNEVELPTIAEGISRPVWKGDQLLLVRRVRNVDGVYVQGCWLNWPLLKEMLLEEVDDLLPGAELKPVYPGSNVSVGRVLATLPVQLVTASPAIATASPAKSTPLKSPSISPLGLSLILAWSCLMMATVAVAALLMGVISLSERRAAFVSAVTHELRTPLTTFRMYTEMLSEGMTSRPEQRDQYVETLRVEADRLSHLVENVLAYAQLERGGKGSQRTETTLGAMIERTQSRLIDRAQQAEMSLVVEGIDEHNEATLKTDPQAVEQILFNLVDNACKYAAGAADKRIHLALTSNDQQVAFKVYDHGPGISRQESQRLFLPFSKSVQQAARSAPGVGLGLALCRRLANALRGRLTLEETAEGGACFQLTLPRDA